MAAQTQSPRAVARTASGIMGRPVTDKQVRGVARDTLGRFDKTAHPAYQSHEYTVAEVKRLLDVFRARKGQGRATSRKASKSATVARKSARTRKVAAQTPEASDGA